MNQNLDLRQSQQLVMTPQLQQAIKLLQLSNVELSDFIEEELEKNPLLEKDDSPLPEDGVSEAQEQQQKDDVDSAFDGNDYDSGGTLDPVGSGGDVKFEGVQDSFENRMSAEKSLRDHLTDQLHLAFSDARDQMIGAFLIDRLDESGYLREDIDDLAQRLGCSAERIDKLLHRMKQFDPAGVFARDLSDCLALQLKDRGAFDAQMEKLLENLDVLGAHDFKALAQICDVNETYLMDMVEEIKTLNPKPASDFDHLVVQTAVPDVLMKRMPKNLGGGWRVELNTHTLPRVLVNQEYYTHVSNGAKGKDEREYITQQLHAANWLVKAMDQRAQTILKTASEIVAQQDAFFNYGIEFLRPLTLKDIASEIEMHESTVSRVTTNKYIGTPRGLFELKFFFSSGVVSDSGAVHSSEAIKVRIKSLIDAETYPKILSDDKLVETLKAEGIDIARRTVAKYREAMHIGSSVQRRKQKKSL